MLYEISVDGDSGDCKVNGSTVLTTVTGAYETASGPFSILGAHTYGAGLAEQIGTKLSNIPSCKIYHSGTKCNVLIMQKSLLSHY